MSDLTPDTLRELAANKQSVHFTHVLAAADVWDADIIAWCDTTVERDTLRQRLEAAEGRVLQLERNLMPAGEEKP